MFFREELELKKIRVSDYIAQFLVKRGITKDFTVPGGGAMFLNHAFSHTEGMTPIYLHHEQACTLAAEGYYRASGKIPLVCVTTGPGGTNAITGVLGSWIDSLPMLVISGQVRYVLTPRGTGLPLRALGDQEYDIVRSIAPMTKYSVMVTDPLTIRYHLEKALTLAFSGRPGPVWLDIPLDVQSALVYEEDLIPYDHADDEVIPEVREEDLRTILEKCRASRRPIFNAGSAIRTAGQRELWLEVLRRLGIPAVTGWNSIDLIEDKDPLYIGRAGLMGDRAGNFAVQNSDFLLSVGSRLSIRQVGYNKDTWAREAYTVVVDIDEVELKKPTLHISLPIHADLTPFLQKFNELLKREGYTEEHPLHPSGSDWRKKTLHWKERYPVVQPSQLEEKTPANVYAFISKLGQALPEDALVVVGNGSACVVGSHAFPIKSHTRFLINSGSATMGYDLPAAVGAAFGTEKKKDIILITGDGSIQMNLQELQSIVHHKLPIHIFLINNGGYHSMRQTQKSAFAGDSLSGTGIDSGDISFPEMERISYAYRIPYRKAESNGELDRVIEESLSSEAPSMTEIFVDIRQNFEPKSATRRTESGQILSPPLEDLAPFLPREELRENMLISLLPEEEG